VRVIVPHVWLHWSGRCGNAGRFVKWLNKSGIAGGDYFMAVERRVGWGRATPGGARVI
jgi:hypothetical protein